MTDCSRRAFPAGVPLILAQIVGAYTPPDSAVSPDLPMRLGRAPRSLSEFLEVHRDLFAGTGGPATNH